MTRTQAACFALIASACVLAGLLLARLGSPLDTPAQAELLLSRGDFTMMTASTDEDDEGLFILDGRRGRLMVYIANPARDRIELRMNLPMSQFFGRDTARGGTGR